MIEEQENAIVISLYDDVTEIIQLADTLGYNSVKTFIQHRKNPDVNSYLGSGKVNEIKKFIDDSDEEISLVIVSGELKPSQWFVLEKKLKRDVFDRVRLILAIFEKRADRKEARLQVKLAQLQYERPFVRELIHRARAGEHPGFMAGGEYQVDDYYEMIKKQVKKIKGELNKIRDDRVLQRQHRHVGGFYLVSLAGYTNAGKSSLLNLLSGEQVKVEGKLFSTLSTTTRRIGNRQIPILLTDTVGFIQHLPALIIDAFHSTLEEIEVADVVLLVVDGSEDNELAKKKLNVSLDELIGLGVNSPIIIILNKIDLLTEDEISKRIGFLQKDGKVKGKTIIPVSIKFKKNIPVLLDAIYDSLLHVKTITIRLPLSEETQAFISWLYEKTHVSSINYDDEVTITVECNVLLKDKIISTCNKLQGSIVS